MMLGTAFRITNRRDDRWVGGDKKGEVSRGSFSHLSETVMSNPYLPPEILDHVFDFLHDESETLKGCCVVSKSWVPRTRRHLFAEIKFNWARDLALWEKTFPDVANSPAYYTRTLLVGFTQLRRASLVEDGGWIRAFSRVESLGVDNGGAAYIEACRVSLAPCHKFSPTLKSLRVGPILLPYPGFFDFICSFPLLEDLKLTGRDDPRVEDSNPHGPQAVAPSTSPVFTGSLDFQVCGGAGRTVRRLLELPNGLHFRKLVLSWDQDLRWIAELVVMCSHTLESLAITDTTICTFVRICACTDSLFLSPVGPVLGSLNFSKATKLRDLVFRPKQQAIKWVAMALQTITPDHKDLRGISIYVNAVETEQTLGEATRRQWLDLDRLLIQLWESHSIRPTVRCARPGGQGKAMERHIRFLLPEITKTRIFDPV